MPRHSKEKAGFYKSLDFLVSGYRVGRDGSLWTNKYGCRWGVRYGEWRKLKGASDRWGYVHVWLSEPNQRKTYLLHRLVLMAFVGPCPPRMEGCHRDGDPTNNKLENLFWDTHEHNQRQRIAHGTTNKGKSFNSGEKHPLAKLTRADVDLIRELHAAGTHTTKEIAYQFGVCMGTINRITRGQGWR